MKTFLKHSNNLKKMPDMVKVLKNKEAMVKKKRHLRPEKYKNVQKIKWEK